MKNSPLVSVTIPAYNHEKYIRQTIESIIAQTYQNIELLIVDDGSSDRTYKIIQLMKERCEKRFQRVVFERHEHQGITATGNRLRELIQGEYIFAIASDDIAKPNAIEVLANFLTEHPDYGLVVGDNEIIDAKAQIIYWDHNRYIARNKQDAVYCTHQDYRNNYFLYLWSHLNKDDFPPAHTFDALPYYRLWFDNPITNGCLSRTSLHLTMLPYSVNCPYEDMFMAMELAKHSKVKVLSDVLFSYRWHKTNSMRNDNFVNISDKLQRIYEIYLLEKHNPELLDTKELKMCPTFFDYKKEWNKSKKSHLWDEDYYVNKYPEVKEKGYIPLVHYLAFGVRDGLSPSAFFDVYPEVLVRGINPLLTKITKYRLFKIHLYRRLWERLNKRLGLLRDKKAYVAELNRKELKLYNSWKKMGLFLNKPPVHLFIPAPVFTITGSYKKMYAVLGIPLFKAKFSAENTLEKIYFLGVPIVRIKTRSA